MSSLFLEWTSWTICGVTYDLRCLSLMWQQYNAVSGCWHHGPLTRLRVTHAPGMPRTFSPPLWISDFDMYHATCITHVPWCMPGSLTSSFLWSRLRGNIPSIHNACATHNFTYLARGPWKGHIALTAINKTTQLSALLFHYVIATHLKTVQQ